MSSMKCLFCVIVSRVCVLYDATRAQQVRSKSNLINRQAIYCQARVNNESFKLLRALTSSCETNKQHNQHVLLVGLFDRLIQLLSHSRCVMLILFLSLSLLAPKFSYPWRYSETWPFGGCLEMYCLIAWWSSCPCPWSSIKTCCCVIVSEKEKWLNYDHIWSKSRVNSLSRRSNSEESRNETLPYGDGWCYACDDGNSSCDGWHGSNRIIWISEKIHRNERQEFVGQYRANSHRTFLLHRCVAPTRHFRSSRNLRKSTHMWQSRE